MFVRARGGEMNVRAKRLIADIQIKTEVSDQIVPLLSRHDLLLSTLIILEPLLVPLLHDVTRSR
jgi:hypothetical protein